MPIEIKKYLLAALILLVLIGLYILFYLLNKNTPKPEGCEGIDENCEGCQVTSCANRKNKNEEEEI